MVLSSWSYGHFKIPYYPHEQLNDDKSAFFSEDVGCNFFENDCVVKIKIAIENTKWIFVGKEKLRSSSHRLNSSLQNRERPQK